MRQLCAKSANPSGGRRSLEKHRDNLKTKDVKSEEFKPHPTTPPDQHPHPSGSKSDEQSQRHQDRRRT